MQTTTTISNITYTRSKHAMDIICKGPFKHKTDLLSGEKFEDGMIILFRRPMGSDVYISLFGGEQTFMLHQMGGHGLAITLISFEVDGWAVTLMDEYSHRKAKREGKRSGRERKAGGRLPGLCMRSYGNSLKIVFPKRSALSW